MILKNWILLLICFILLGTTSCTVTVIDRAPVAQFSFWPEAPWTFETVYFDASSSYDPATIIVIGLEVTAYQWDFGDGNFGKGVNASHHYRDDGWYKVILTVRDDGGQEASTSRWIRVKNRPPIADFTWYNCSSVFGIETQGIVPLICKVFDAGLSRDLDGWIVDYQWDFGDGHTGRGKKVWHEFGEGLYTIKLTVTDNDGARSSKKVKIQF